MGRKQLMSKQKKVVRTDNPNFNHGQAAILYPCYDKPVTADLDETTFTHGYKIVLGNKRTSSKQIYNHGLTKNMLKELHNYR